MQVRRLTLPALNVLVVLGVAFLVVILPRLAGEFRLIQFTNVGIYFIALLGLNILTGYSGQISLGHGAFMLLGAYTSAVLMLGRHGLVLAGHHPPHWLPIGDGMRPIFTIPIAGLVAGLVGYAFGFPALRLAGVSLALATFAVAVSLPLVAKRFEDVTGGGGGLNLSLPRTPFGLDISVSHWLYYETWASAALLFVIAWLLLRGRAGRALRALRDGEVAAVASGVSPAAYKTFSFGVSSAYAGVAGALFVISQSYVNPDTIPILWSILFLASVVIGGLASLTGALFGALIFQFLPIYAQEPPLLPLSLSKQAPSVVFGAALILMMFLAPNGIAGLVRRFVQPLTNRLGRSRIELGERERSVGPQVKEERT
jgi:branched-chain amino acid transport system permease protein